MIRDRIVRLALLVVAVTGVAWGSGVPGDLAAYLALGLLPGLAAADLLAPRTGLALRLALGFALAPLVTTAIAWPLMTAGIDMQSAAKIALVAAALLLMLHSRWQPEAPTPSGSDDPGQVPAAAWGIGLALAALVAIPPIVNAYVLVRGDTWTHAGIVMTILERGVPPEDPRFAGIALHYPWFYNFFIALLDAVRGERTFAFMVMLNVATAYATVCLIAATALRLWRRRDAAVGAAVLAVVGLNAGAWLLWPVRLVRALVGETRGLDEIARQLATVEFSSARIIYSLSAPFALMVSTLDKLLVGSPLAYGYLLMGVHAWAVLAWLEEGSARSLLVALGAAAGMMLFHGVVGLSVNPVWIGALTLAALIATRVRWLPSAGRLFAAAAATLAGAMLATPYMLSVSSGWEGNTSGLRHSYFAPDWVMPWTLITACAFALGFALGPYRAAWRERRPLAAVVTIGLLAMIAFALIVRLPEHNEVKFVYQVFMLAALLAAPGFLAWAGGFLARRRVVAAVVLAAVFLVPSVLTLCGYGFDPEAHTHPSVTPHPGENELYRWIREHTGSNAMFVDSGFRDLVMVRGRRSLYLGTSFGPERAAFPLNQVLVRRRVVADLYGSAGELDADLVSFERFKRPVYVIFRPEEDDRTTAARALLERSDRFELVYQRHGYRVYSVIQREGKA